jgi:hypothetical protein
MMFGCLISSHLAPDQTFSRFSLGPFPLCPQKADHALVGDFDRLDQFFAKNVTAPNAGGRDELPPPHAPAFQGPRLWELKTCTLSRCCEGY